MSIAEHHRRRAYALHFQRFSWFGFLAAGLLVIQLLTNIQAAGAQGVLAYATNMSRTDLYAMHNQQRVQAGLGSLRLNSALNSAAQAKAEHMIANNYWSHVAPDGTTPWYFFDQAGYDYSNAGENLAYGFLTSEETMNGWMNSAGHRANILGNYADVGFGIASGPSYQGGENTVVVALFGTPVNYQPAAQPAVTESAATTPPPALKPASAAPAPVQTAPAPVEQAPIVPAAGTNETLKETAAPLTADQPKPAATLQAPQQEQRVTTLQSLLSSERSWPLYASLIIVAISSVGFTVTHVRLLQLNWNRGVRFALTHPLLDGAVVAGVSLFILSATVGFVG